jgi:hypothetical protein
VVLSMFDGMGGCWQALKDLGIPVKKGYSCEIVRRQLLFNYFVHTMWTLINLLPASFNVAFCCRFK